MVPLSRAVCCRPCLPSRLPPQLAGLAGDGNVTTAVAIVSIGCHKSAAQGLCIDMLRRKLLPYSSFGLSSCTSDRPGRNKRELALDAVQCAFQRFTT